MGQMATLVQRTPKTDVLFKRLADGDDAVAVFNRSEAPVKVELHPAEFGFAVQSGCVLDTRDLWNGKEQSSASALQAEVASHDTVIWRIHPSAQCGKPSRTRTITLTANAGARLNALTEDPGKIDGYVRCLASPGPVEACGGAAAERWTVTARRALLRPVTRCLAVANGKPAMQACRPQSAQHWHYTLTGNLISNTDHQCLSAGPQRRHQRLEMQPCGHNLPNEIWSLPN